MKLSLAGNAPSKGISLASNKGKQPARPGSAFSSNKLTGSSSKSQPNPSSKKNAFGDEDEQDEDGYDEDGGRQPIASTSKSSLAASTKNKKADPTRPGVKSASSNPSRLLKKMHDEAEAIDPSVFSYDEVYDSMKAGAQALQEAKKKEKQLEGDKPKYVSGLLAAAEQRKKDRIRAEDKLIEMEREKEGDEFKDKESFVTSAYKEQQAELRKAEEEERLREEQESKRPGGMAEYYKRALAEQEAVHAAAMAAASAAASSSKESPSSSGNGKLTTEQADLAAHGPKSEAAIAQEASAALGRHIQVNEDGQIVDKRELLTGGLNIKPRKVLGPASGPPKGFALSIAERKSQQAEVEKLEKERKERENQASLEMTGLTMEQRKKMSRERQSAEMQRQLLEAQERKRKAEEDKEKELVKKVARRNNDESKIEELKRKALERRLAKQQEQQQQIPQ